MAPSVSNLFPAIAQAFAVIIIGYVFGFFKIIVPKDAKSIGTLVGKLALPALLFKNLAILDLTSISWPFLGSMLLAKFCVFAGVALITVVVSRPFNIGRGGIFGIFATQSNDFALGLPIVQALYGTSSSEGFNYVSYIYLLAPVSLGIINPIGFTFMELQKQLSTRSMSWRQIPMILLRTVKGVVFNPVIFMTILGLIVNVILTFGLHRTDSDDNKLPDWLTGFLDILGGAYAACALFNIGIFMVGKMKSFSLTLLLISLLLIIAKTILLPLIAYRIVYTLVPGYQPQSDEPSDATFNSTRQDIATFGFLLGSFPTAPTVFVFASQYNIAMEVVATSLVLCTFLSAPIMYVIARMALITYASIDEYHSVIAESQRDVTIVACICLVWVFVLFMLSRRYKSYLHVFVLHLVIAMLIEVVSVNILGVVTKYDQLYWKFFWFGLFFIGVLSTRTWMASLGIGILLLLSKGPAVAEKAWVPLMLTTWGIPVAITILLVSICSANPQRLHKNLVDITFLFGEAQLVISLALLIICFFITAISVFLIIMQIRRFQKEAKLRSQRVDKEDTPETSLSSSPDLNNGRISSLRNSRHSSRAVSPTLQGAFNEDLTERSIVKRSPIGDQSEIVFENSAEAAAPFLNTQTGFVGESTPLLTINKDEIQADLPTTDFKFGTLTANTGIWDKDTSGKNLIRFVILLLLLVFSSFVGILIVIWKILSPDQNGIFIAVNILDTITNFGQGFFVFLVFGFEKHWFWSTLYQKTRSLVFKVETVELPPEKDLDINILTLCAIFRTKYMQHCKESILSKKRFYWRTYDSVFSGKDMVDWLIERGIVNNREDAVQYSQSLLLGRVIAHVQGEHYFHDFPYFYEFTR